ncbi:YmiA family putative membrane protein [Martelella alba]|uniref:YmiA family putative membrane protein n=1 Tax=Martelella alba TaxID=2590451 RepID=A0ABY2SR30_9HYPH|nr:YmiA family putative membrane protein [Martelella alba]
MDNGQNTPPKRTPDLKRKAWIVVFLSCAVFWCIIGLVAYWLW